MSNRHRTTFVALLFVLAALALTSLPSSTRTVGASAVQQTAASYRYPFQNPDLPADVRIANLLSLMTREEKVLCLSTNPSVPRLGVRGSGHSEGLHGLAQGGPAKWGRDMPTTTTTFPQSYGLGETWDTDLLREVGAAEGYEARYIFQR